MSAMTEKRDLAYIAVLLVAMMGAAVTTLQPLIIGAYTDSGLLTIQQVSWVAICDVTGILLVSTSAFFWVRRCHWYAFVLASLAVFIAANFATGWVDSFYGLAVIRFVAGAACGVSYAITLAALGDRKDPDQAFGDLVTAQVIFGTIGFAVLPHIIELSGYFGVYVFFNVFLIIALLAVIKGLPQNKRVQESFELNLLPIWKPTAAIFLAVVTYYFAQGALWAYLERIGVQAGLSSVEIGLYLSLGFGISAAGSAISGWFVGKYGRVAATWVTVAIQVPCLFLLFMLNPPYASILYAIATIIYQIFWSFIVPVMMATFSDIDKSGRLIVFCVSAFKIGLVLGTPFAGYLITVGDLYDVVWASAVAIVISGMFLVTAVKLNGSDTATK